MLHQSSVRSKVDWYKNHAFANIVAHRTLGVSADDDDDEDADPFAPNKPKATPENNGHHFGFHSTRRNPDEESIVDARDGGNSSPDYESGASTPAVAGSHAEYNRALRRAFKRVKTPADAEQRTVRRSLGAEFEGGAR